MPPSQDPTAQIEGTLEDRLRGLILNNANGQSTVVSPSTGQSSNGQSSTGQPTTTHKRPNQASRRQMNAQLSIPIDARPVQGTQAGRGMGMY